MMISEEVYYNEVLGVMPRILNLLNRNAASKSFGSFDRDYWNYKAFDISCARKQEAALTLALIYKIKKKNKYFNSKLILKWINAALIYWTKIQNKNSSFDEVYPNENAFNTTAFTSYTTSETLLQLKDEEIQNKDLIIASLKKAGDWLLNKEEGKVFNQETGAAIALYNIYLLTKEDKYRADAENKIRHILKHQMSEGWFYEYGGADIGYLSLSIDYLAKYYQKTNDKQLLAALKEAVNFISYFVHPDYTFGGEYGSRNTEYMIPHGFEILSKEIHTAAEICQAIRHAISIRSTVAPSTIDDKYLLFNSYTYLQAYIDSSNNKVTEKLPYKQNFTKMFKESCLWINSNNYAYTLANYKKGGAIKVIYKENKNSIDDSGIVIKYKNNKILTSGNLSNNNSVHVIRSKLQIKGYLGELPDISISPLKFILLRSFQITFGRSEKISLRLKNMLRKSLIMKNMQTSKEFARDIEIQEDRIIVVDNVDYSKNIDFIIVSSKNSTIYGSSSRYFQESDLCTLPITYNVAKMKRTNKTKHIKIIREYDTKGKIIRSELIFVN